MYDLQPLLDNNAHWARDAIDRDPGFFRRLVGQQTPKYLWIGCSDSRVPANEIVGLQPGELFVHRNLANVVSQEDANCQSVLEFAVSVLKVEHIIVVGHYGCSAVAAALRGTSAGPHSQHWLGHVHRVASQHHDVLCEEKLAHRRESLLCELNVMEQAINVCESKAACEAWGRGQPLTVQGWIYRLGDGRLRHLDFSVTGPQHISVLRERALMQVIEARRKYYGPDGDSIRPGTSTDS